MSKPEPLLALKTTLNEILKMKPTQHFILFTFLAQFSPITK
jgi:hypothetical protein